MYNLVMICEWFIFVIVVYNEVLVLLLLYLWLCVVFDGMFDIDGYIFYVDDGSYDCIWEVIVGLV